MSKLVKNTLIYSVGNIVTALTAFLLLPLYTKYLTVADFGITNSMQTLSSVLVIILSLALERSVFRIYHDYPLEKDKKDFLGTIFIALILFGVLGVLICFLSDQFLNKLFPTISFNPFYVLTIIYSFIASLINFIQIIAQVRQNAKQFIIISSLINILTITINIVLIVEFKQEALGYVRGVLYGVLLVFPLAFFYVHQSINYTFNFDKFKNAFAFSFPMFPSLLSAWVLNLSDRVFIDHYYTHADVGVYSLAYRIASITSFVSMAIFMAYNPLFYDVANHKSLNLQEKKDKLFKINSGMVLLIGIIGIMVLGSADLILKLFFSKAYSSAYSYISVFTFSFIIGQICGLLNLMVYQNRRSKAVALIITFCAVVNIGLNYLLIPKYGVYYAAITTLVCNLLNFSLMYILAKRSFFVRFEWRTISAICICYGLVFMENYILKDKSLVFLISTKAVTVVAILLVFKNQILNLATGLKINKLNKG